MRTVKTAIKRKLRHYFTQHKYILRLQKKCLFLLQLAYRNISWKDTIVKYKLQLVQKSRIFEIWNIYICIACKFWTSKWSVWVHMNEFLFFLFLFWKSFNFSRYKIEQCCQIFCVVKLFLIHLNRIVLPRRRGLVPSNLVCLQKNRPYNKKKINYQNMYNICVHNFKI